MDSQVYEVLKGIAQGGSNGMGADGQNLTREDLEPIARNTLWSDQQHQAMRRVPSFGAAQPKHEFALLKSVGNMWNSRVVAEFQTPRREAFRGRRGETFVGMLAVQNAASLQARLSKQTKVLGESDPFIANKNALVKLLQAQKNVELWHGDTRTSHVPSYQMKGIFQQHEVAHANSGTYPNNPLYMPTTYLVDCRGRRPTRLQVQQAAGLIREAWGCASDFACPARVFEDFQFQIEDGFQTERLMVKEEDGRPIRIGQPVGGIWTPYGAVDFFEDGFIGRDWRFSAPSEQDSEFVYDDDALSAPDAPSVSVNDAAAGSLWQAADVADAVEIKYKIQPIGTDGVIGRISAASSVAAVGTGDSVSVTFTTVASAAAYRVLRNSADFPSRYYEIGRVANSAESLTFVDKNHIMPGMDQGAIYEMAMPRVMKGGEIHSLAASEIDNVISLAYLGDREGPGQTQGLPAMFAGSAEMIYEFVGPMLSQPRRLVRFINMGRRAAA